MSPEQVFKIISEIGFPIAASIASLYFVFLAIKFILNNVKTEIEEANDKLLKMSQEASQTITKIELLDKLINVMIKIK